MSQGLQMLPSGPWPRLCPWLPERGNIPAKYQLALQGIAKILKLTLTQDVSNNRGFANASLLNLVKHMSGRVHPCQISVGTSRLCQNILSWPWLNMSAIEGLWGTLEWGPLAEATSDQVNTNVFTNIRGKKKRGTKSIFRHKKWNLGQWPLNSNRVCP